ncbi:hypothetical protein L596_019219 [Steinernema carpocapsae]|uniref:mitogen-activated protein kinase kinase n=1 Tax=Steinernema carpocapsae TaxID=34508 RepID=A0A4V6A0H5_STECR|nr:hypothetical protein L596_019219 [Steinernema carpocapsae]
MDRPTGFSIPSNVSISEFTQSYSFADKQEIDRFSSNSGLMCFDNVTYENVAVCEFNKGKKLGSGAFGNVFEATFARNDKKVAVKECVARINSENYILLGWAKRMGRELEINSTSHQCENLLKCHGYIITPESHVFLYLELMSISLAQLSRAVGKISDRFVGKFAVDVVTGMHYLRRLQMVHRDLKPDNMLIDEFGMVKLADFGFIGYVTHMSVVSNTLGVTLYTAPEVFTTLPGAPPYKSSVDVWSFAISMLELIRGEHPLVGQEHDLLNAVIPALTREEAPFLHELINDCLRRKPSERPRIQALPDHEAIRRIKGETDIREEVRQWLRRFLA